MAHKCSTSVVIPTADINAVWSIISDFNGMNRIMKDVVSNIISDSIPNNTVGCVRRLDFPDGNFVEEELIEFISAEYTLTYIILKTAMPITNYKATVKLEVGPDDGVTFKWDGEFDANEGVDGVAFAKGIEENVYKAAISGLVEVLNN